MRKLIPALLVGMLLVGCADATDSNPAATYSVNQEASLPIAATPEPSPVDIVQSDGEAITPSYEEIALPVADELDAEPIGIPQTPQTNEHGRVPLDSDHPFWEIYGEGAYLTVCVDTGALWNHDMQITFPRDGVFTLYDPDEDLGEPAEPLMPVAPEFTPSLLRVGVYPTEWDGAYFVTALAFNEALLAHNTNMRIHTHSDLATHEFIGPNSGPIGWNNMMVSIGLFRLENPEPGVFGRMSLQAWLTGGRHPDTGELFYEQFEIFHSDDRRAGWQTPNYGPVFGIYFARMMWDAFAMLDQATTLDEIFAAQRAFQ